MRNSSVLASFFLVASLPLAALLAVNSCTATQARSGTKIAEGATPLFAAIPGVGPGIVGVSLDYLQKNESRIAELEARDKDNPSKKLSVQDWLFIFGFAASAGGAAIATAKKLDMNQKAQAQTESADRVYEILRTVSDALQKNPDSVSGAEHLTAVAENDTKLAQVAQVPVSAVK